MKSLFKITIFAFLGLGVVGCSDDDVFDPIPAAPQGVFSVTGNNAVYIWFNGPYEADVVAFIIWRSLDPVANYSEIGRTAALSNANLDLIIYEFADTTAQNGITYFYAVSSVDVAGQVSSLSAENVFDTPRPEGLVVLRPNNLDPALSGYNLETNQHVYDTSINADFFIDIFDGIYYINAGAQGTVLQDLGYTESFDDVSWAPDTAWSELGFVELIQDHTYVIRTVEAHYAKVRLLGLSLSGSVNFQWAFQTDQFNRELVAPQDNPEAAISQVTSETMSR